ncbi:homeodomain super, partial [Teratosphaeriaceae sp. CCFEE 6253]
MPVIEPDHRGRAPYGRGPQPTAGTLDQYGRAKMDGGQHYSTPDHTPTSTAHHREFPPLAAYPPPSRDSEATRTRRTSEYSDGQSTTDGPQHHATADRPLSHHQPSTYPPARHPCAAQRDYHGIHPDEDRFPRPPVLSHAPPFDRSPFESTSPSYFMPSQYDYQHGKSRKRSNLPKQSTEIMKTWFDRNIINPYP